MTMKSTAHKGYVPAAITLNPETGVLSGTVAGVRAVLHFQGDTPAEVLQAFRDTVDDYLDWCAERGKAPEKPYSGKLSLRLDPDVHRLAAQKAAAEGVSVNAWIAGRIQETFGLNH